MAACGGSEPPPSGAATVAVSVSSGSLHAPDTIEAGWVRLRVQEQGKGHILVVFRVPDTATPAELTSFRAALDTARMTPPPARALGGPEIGDTGAVVLNLARGRYLLACLGRGPEGHRHANSGEAAVVEVVAASNPREAPVPTRKVTMADFAYGADATWPTGDHLVHVENTGRQDHHLRIDRLPAGGDLGQWLASEGEIGEPVAGVARTSPGEAVYLPVRLPAGSYVLYCLIPDAVSGEPHAIKGMFRALTVE
jgi:hypothetical protein